MYIEAVPNRNSPPAILLRESYRVDGKVKKRTLLNLSDWPTELIEGLRTLLKGGTALPPGQEAIIIKRSLPHGHVAAVLGTLRRIGLDRLLGPTGGAPNRCRDLVVAMIVARLIAPLSKLATAKALDPITAACSLGEILGLGAVDEDELYTALDWLLERQPQIEAALARRHLKNGTLVLYDVSSSYFEGHCCPLAQFGFNRDGKRGKMQIVYGLLCAADGCPVAIEVFEGSTGDPATLAAQVDKLKRRFDLTHVVLVGDRGMITQTRINEDIKPAGLDWITALRAPQVRVLVDSGVFQLSLFDQRDLASITADDYPGERLIVCRNPELAVARRRKREDLLTATERNLAEIQNRVRRARKPLRGIAKIGLKVGAVVGKYKMAKHFTLTITDTDFSFARKQDAIDAEARLDGIYVIRTNLKAPTLDDSATVRAYKSLAQVERAIRSPSICRSGRSSIGQRHACALTSFYVCSPITSNGICANASPRCSTTTPIRQPPRRCGPVSSPKRSARPRPSPNKPTARRRMACRCTACKHFSPTSPRSRETPSPPHSIPLTSSSCTPARRCSSKRRSISSL